MLKEKVYSVFDIFIFIHGKEVKGNTQIFKLIH